MTEQPYNPLLAAAAAPPAPAPDASAALQAELDAANKRIQDLIAAAAEPAPAPAAAEPPSELEQLRQRLQAAEQMIAQLSGKTTALVARVLPAHWLHLADGTVLESEGAVPTHVAVGDKVVPVVRAYER